MKPLPHSAAPFQTAAAPARPQKFLTFFQNRPDSWPAFRLVLQCRNGSHSRATRRGRQLPCRVALRSWLFIRFETRVVQMIHHTTLPFFHHATLVEFSLRCHELRRATMNSSPRPEVFDPFGELIPSKNSARLMVSACQKYSCEKQHSPHRADFFTTRPPRPVKNLTRPI